MTPLVLLTWLVLFTTVAIVSVLLIVEAARGRQRDQPVEPQTSLEDLLAELPAKQKDWKEREERLYAEYDLLLERLRLDRDTAPRTKH